MRNTNAEQSLRRAVSLGLVAQTQGRSWLAGVRKQAELGTFEAEMTKVLWVALAPGRRL